MMLMEAPELALMGSCVLEMVMKGNDVYLMNVGDSRAVLAKKTENDGRPGKDLVEMLYGFMSQEVKRIRTEQPDDPFAIFNERVKGSLKAQSNHSKGKSATPSHSNIPDGAPEVPPAPQRQHLDHSSGPILIESSFILLVI
ncbi:unnamed protein product [Fraxinus pennsylvanica]|uniref:PPM-type phosphatase domain-containing protein n=1 Tax=Fraxinus pennsylvanica TaxID=56036 RepID=A0AAD2E541_9LAMI|nr:unnamed protein product [Fraxinus pennsylvanica]